MFDSHSLISSSVFRELVNTGSIVSARVEAIEGGAVILAKIGMHERALGAARGGVRLFKSLDGAASVLQSFGITKFAVSTDQWIPVSVIRGHKRATVRQDGRPETETGNPHIQ